MDQVGKATNIRSLFYRAVGRMGQVGDSVTHEVVTSSSWNEGPCNLNLLMMRSLRISSRMVILMGLRCAVLSRSGFLMKDPEFYLEKKRFVRVLNYCHSEDGE